MPAPASATRAGEGEFRDRSWIALNFINDGENVGGEDRIDASTVAASDFTVGGHAVMDVVVPSDKKVCKGDDPATADEDESGKNITAYDADDGDPVEEVPAVLDNAEHSLRTRLRKC